MNEKAMLEVLMNNPAFRAALKDMVIRDEQLAKELGLGKEKQMYVWCVEMVTEEGVPYYHPLIIPARTGFNISVDEMLDVNFYKMMASDNQFDVYNYEGMVNLFKSMYVHPVRMLTIPEKTYESLSNALRDLITTILAEAETCFVGFDNIARITHVNADQMKSQFLMSVFSNMTIVSTCIDQEMQNHDSADHGYEVHKRCDMHDDEDEEWDDEWDEDDVLYEDDFEGHDA